MNKSKLLYLLKSLSKSELKQLRTWIIQTSDKKDAVKLFLHIYKQLQKSRGVSKEELHEILYSKKKYNDSRMRFLLFELFQLCEEFIAYRSVEANDVSKQLALLQFYRERQCDKLFQQTETQLKKHFETTSIRDQDYFLGNMKLQKEKSNFLKSKQKRSIEPNMQNYSDQLDWYYITSKLKIYSEALNYESLLKVNYNIRFVNTLLRELTDADFKSYPSLRIQKLAVNTLTPPQNEIHFFQLKKELEAHQSVFSREDLNDLYALARNYCIRKINKGEKKFVRSLFELYQSEIELISKDSQPELSPAVFKNIVTIALDLKEIKWVQQFINDYSGFLPASQRESLINYNTARLHFINCNYDKVARLLVDVSYPDFFLQLSAKALLLKTYFETESEQAFDSLVHSFRELLYSKKQLGYHKDNYLNFISFSEKLFHSEWKSQSEKRKIFRDVRQIPELVEREWLIKKLEPLLKN